jgi:hypothetical protein
MLLFPLTAQPAGLSLVVLCFMTVLALLFGGLAFDVPSRGAQGITIASLGISLGGLVWGGMAALVASRNMTLLEYMILSLYVILYAIFGLVFAMLPKHSGETTEPKEQQPRAA